MRGLFNKTATVKRLSAYSGDKATFQIVPNVEIEGHFYAIDKEGFLLDLRIAGQAYGFECEAEFFEILPNDILIIDNVEYNVKGVSKNEMKSLYFIRCILEKATP